MVFVLFRLYLCSTSTGRVQMDGDHENGFEQHQTHRLGLVTTSSNVMTEPCYLYSRSVLRVCSLLPTVVDWVQAFGF